MPCTADGASCMAGLVCCWGGRAGVRALLHYCGAISQTELVHSATCGVKLFQHAVGCTCACVCALLLCADGSSAAEVAVGECLLAATAAMQCPAHRISAANTAAL